MHGRDRRHERGITKVDLHLARAHGTCEPARDGRWKFTLGNVVFITDATTKKEITSYVVGQRGKAVGSVCAPVRVDAVDVAVADVLEHARCARALRAGPSACKSHTVLVVDQSASMRASDVAHFLTRSDAVFATLALDFVGKQVDAGNATMTDAVSLVVMRDDAIVEFEREPLTNVVFNTLVARIGRYGAEGPGGHGNYVPALDAAARLFAGDVGNGTVTLKSPSRTGPAAPRSTRLRRSDSYRWHAVRSFGRRLRS